MGKYLDNAKKLRNEVPCNCAQAVLLSFEELLPVERSEAMALGSNFGGGMKIGTVCGAITGGLMVMGLLGCSNAKALFDKVKANHQGLINCKDLLEVNDAKGGTRKAHCDGMIFESVEIVENILRENGIIKD
ncbi:MAG: C-GCAxxG-C-C family protein [Clostridiales bacterium]|nr:C-GCAxxG-C-C family protein [Clostridiales bacterium]